MGKNITILQYFIIHTYTNWLGNVISFLQHKLFIVHPYFTQFYYIIAGHVPFVDPISTSRGTKI